MKTNNTNPGSDKILLKVTKVFFLLLIAAVINSCTYRKNYPIPECPPTASGGFVVVSHTEKTSTDVMEQVNMQPNYPGYYDYTDMYLNMQADAGGNGLSINLIAHDIVHYTSTDNNGNPVTLSGLLIYPWSNFKTLKAPIVSVNHGTILMKNLAPSRWKKASYSDWKKFPEMAVGDMLCLWYGWIIIMPDYQGMGDDSTENHPYCIRDRLGVATADMLQAAEDYYQCGGNTYVSWDGQAYLYGYSEGGYVTMAAAKELEERDVKLNGVVCMDGPYDLSGTMLNTLLGENPFPVPYFLPMMLVGYNTMYPAIFDYTGMLKEPYRTDIPKYTTGFYDIPVVNSIMPQDKILKKVFTDSFYDSLRNNQSLAFQAMQDNNSYLGWMPKSKMLVWHCKNDDCVPFGNLVAARDRFSTLGISNIEYVEWPAVEHDPSGSTVHVSVAPTAFMEGAKWIYHQSKK
ncbi:MAG: lipase family protein [Bacteroidota bacterium]|jgi:pimeloyl-ACP methyl ester carboxylesterase